MLIAFPDLGTMTFFLQQNHHWLEEVGVEADGLIQLVEAITGDLSFIAVVANQLAHHGPVLLFHVSLIVLPVGSGAGESDLLLFTVAFQVGIDELAAIVGVES